MYNYQFKCYRVAFASNFEAIEVRNRISDALVADFDLTGDPVEVKVDPGSDSFELALLPGGLSDPVVNAPAIDISQNANFNVEAATYGGIGVSDIRDTGFRTSAFLLNNGTMTFQLINGMMHMVGKAADEALPFYYEMERATASTPASECP